MASMAVQNQNNKINADMHAAQPPSPPSKRDLTSWWSNFKKRTKKEEEKIAAPVGIFGVPLAVSIKYANVAISLQNDNGESYVYGYVPIIVAKCGVYLKEHGTDVHGIFRLPGAAKRIKELQTTFDSPDRYGRGLDWTGYTVHDAGSIFRRYINALPEPVIPLEYYDRYRDPLRNHQKAATDDPDLTVPDALPAEMFDHGATIAKYQQLIKELPALNRQLLLYILDLLAVFSSKSEINGMDQFNLSAVFQPGILSHPVHDLKPVEYKLSQNVLVYLIVNQDHFLVGMEGTQVDDKTVQHVQSQALPRAPISSQSVAQVARNTLGRSASNASAGTDSQRKASLMRRTASVSSKASNLSSTPHVPNSPMANSPLVTVSSGGGGGGIYRSNTAPSRRSSALNSPRYAKANNVESPVTTSSLRHPSQALSIGEEGQIESQVDQQPIEVTSVMASTPLAGSTTSHVAPLNSMNNIRPEVSPTLPDRAMAHQPSNTTEQAGNSESDSKQMTAASSKDFKSLFSKGLAGLPEAEKSEKLEKKDGKTTNKLRKKNRPPDGIGPMSAQSSTHSLQGALDVMESPKALSPGSPSMSPVLTGLAVGGIPMTIPTVLNSQASPLSDSAPRLNELDHLSSFHATPLGGSRAASPNIRGSSPLIGPSKSPVPSAHSVHATDQPAPRMSSPDFGGTRVPSSRHDLSDEERVIDDTSDKDKGTKRRSRWRLSASVKRDHDHPMTPAGSRIHSPAAPEERSVPLDIRPVSEALLGRSNSPSPPLDVSSVQANAAVSQSSPSNIAPKTHDISVSHIEPQNEKSKRDTTSDKDDEGDMSKEKRGLFGRIKDKVIHPKDDKRDKDKEKEKEKEKEKVQETSSIDKDTLAQQSSEKSLVPQENVNVRKVASRSVLDPAVNQKLSFVHDNNHTTMPASDPAAERGQVNPGVAAETESTGIDTVATNHAHVAMPTRPNDPALGRSSDAAPPLT